MWRQCWGTGKHLESVSTLIFLFPSLYKEEKSRIVAYQKDIIETQSKNPEQPPSFSGAAFPSVSNRTLSHFSKLSPRDIQSTTERHSPSGRCHPAHQIDIRDSTVKELLVLPFLPGEKEEETRIPLGLQEEYCYWPHHTRLQKWLCTTVRSHQGHRCPQVGFWGKPCKHHLRNKHRRRWIFLRELFFNSTSIKYRKDQINPLITPCVYMLAHT